MHDRFKKRILSLPASVRAKIAEIDTKKSAWNEGAQLDRQVLETLKRSVLITSSGASTRIEGAQLSDEDVEKMMRGLSMQKFSDRDKQEVRGYYELLDNVFTAYPSIPFSESTIKFFHKELLKYAEKDKLHRGEYKKKENKVEMVNAAGQSIGTLFDTTPAYLTPKEMQELIEWTNTAFLEKEIHPLLVIGNFIVEFLNIHPFEDGNGRLSRVLTNLLLLQHGYVYMPYISHEKLVEDNKPEYYLALRQSQKSFRTDYESIEPFIRFFLNVLLIQTKQAVDLLSTKQLEGLLSKQQTLVWQYMQKVGEATPLEISEATGVPRPTVSQALTKLMRLKKVQRVGLGRGTRYHTT
ncbi:MAG: Fic family protein [Candidatus Pacebacteria bacterium]|nr:Fic family protein [Candidatus Paceibacterota bacterium]